MYRELLIRLNGDPTWARNHDSPTGTGNQVKPIVPGVSDMCTQSADGVRWSDDPIVLFAALVIPWACVISNGRFNNFDVYWMKKSEIGCIFLLKE